MTDFNVRTERVNRFHVKYVKRLKLTIATDQLSGKFSGCLETFQAVWKLFMLSGYCSVCLETFQVAWKLTRRT